MVIMVWWALAEERGDGGAATVVSTARPPLAPGRALKGGPVEATVRGLDHARVETLSVVRRRLEPFYDLERGLPVRNRSEARQNH